MNIYGMFPLGSSHFYSSTPGLIFFQVLAICHFLASEGLFLILPVVPRLLALNRLWWL